MQPPGDVGILGGVAGGALELDMVELDRLLAGAADVLVGDAGVAQVAQRQLVHAVAGHPLLAAAGVEIEADHHGIVDRRHPHAVAGEDVDVVLGVLPDLEHRVAFQQRPQPGHDFAGVELHQLLGEHVVAAVRQRDVAGLVRPHRQADAADLRRDRIERRRLGIEGDQPRGECAGDPAVERFEALDAFVGGMVDVGHVGQRLARCAGDRPCPGIDRFRRVELRRLCGTARARPQPPQQAGEAVPLKERGERRGRNLAELERIHLHRQRAIFAQLHQHAAEPRHVGLLDQRIAQLARLHFRRGRQRGFEAAMILNQLRRGFRTYPPDTRNVVHRIAHQGEHVAEQLGRHAELLDHLGHVDPLVLHRVEHVDAAAARVFGVPRLTVGAFADELHQVLVGGHDGDVPAARGGGAGIGGDDVVRLDVVLLDAGQAESAGGIADQRKLGLEVLGRRRTVGLVVLVQAVAERGAGLVEDHREMSRPVRLVEIVGELPQHRGVAIDRADGRSLRVGQRR